MNRLSRARLIPLTKELFAIVDQEDHAYLSQHSWSVDGSGCPQRAIKTASGWRPIRMHRDLLKLGPGQHADHIDGDKLDNRRANLRRCSQAENNRNTPIPRTNRTGFKGVYWNANRQCFQAYITFERKHHYLGSFTDIESAALTYQQVAKRFFGTFARP